jgi:hypothetical protein
VTRSGVLVGLALVCAGAARADDFDDANLDYAASERLAERLAHSVVLLDVTLAVPDWADKALAPRGLALGVVCRGPDGVDHLVASGPIASDAASFVAHLPSGKLAPVTSWRPIGDGALAVLSGVPLEGWTPAPLPADPPPPRPPDQDALGDRPKADRPEALGAPILDQETLVDYDDKAWFTPRPLFAVAIDAQPPVLGRGATVERMRPPLDFLLAVNPKTTPGTAWFDIAGGLVAVTIRPSPEKDELGLAVRGEVLREWLRPEGPPYDPEAPAPRTP